MDEGTLYVEQARRDLECESSERYKGFVVRTRLKRVLNEALKSNTSAREEEVRRFSPSIYRFHQVPGWARAAIES